VWGALVLVYDTHPSGTDIPHSFHLEDASGRRAGWIDGAVVTEIPDASAGQEDPEWTAPASGDPAIDPDPDAAPPPTPRFVLMPDPAEGTVLHVVGSATGAFAVSVDALGDGELLGHDDLTGTTGTGEGQIVDSPALDAIAQPPGTTTTTSTSTTTTSTSTSTSTTSTLPGCTPAPTFASVSCRVGALVAAVDAAPAFRQQTRMRTLLTGAGGKLAQASVETRPGKRTRLVNAAARSLRIVRRLAGKRSVPADPHADHDRDRRADHRRPRAPDVGRARRRTRRKRAARLRRQGERRRYGETITGVPSRTRS